MLIRSIFRPGVEGIQVVEILPFARLFGLLGDGSRWRRSGFRRGLDWFRRSLGWFRRSLGWFRSHNVWIEGRRGLLCVSLLQRRHFLFGTCPQPNLYSFPDDNHRQSYSPTGSANNGNFEHILFFFLIIYSLYPVSGMRRRQRILNFHLFTDLTFFTRPKPGDIVTMDDNNKYRPEQGINQVFKGDSVKENKRQE